MTIIRIIKRIFVHKKNPPRQYISPYKLGGDDEQHLILMRARRARNPQEAARLMRLWNTDNARELIALLPVRRQSIYNRLRPTLAAMLGEVTSAKMYYQTKKDDLL